MPQPITNESKSEHLSPAPSQHAATKKRLGWVWLALGCILAFAAITLALHRRPSDLAGRSKSPATPPAVSVGTVVAEKGDIGVYVNALGSVTPVYTVMVKSRVDGQLMS